MKLITYLAIFFTSAATLNAHAYQCLSQAEASQAAINNLRFLRTELHRKSSFWISSQKMLESIQEIQYSEAERKYKSSILAKWTCAAGSDCYVGVEVDCNGKSDIYLFAD
jgi:hypothetical protein